MLESITWQQYLAATGTVACIYYAYVLYKYYRKNILDKLNNAQELIEDYDNEVMIKEAAEAEAEDALQALEYLVNSIKSSIFEKAGKTADKEELKENILVLAASYNGLQKPAYRSALNNFIIRYGNEICGVDFSEEELEEMWISIRR